MKVVIFAPHYDDESIGVGGAIAKHLSQNHKIRICFVSDGSASHISFSGTKTEYANLRKQEAINAIDSFGSPSLVSVEYYEETEGFLQHNANLIIKVAKTIRLFKPDIVYIPHIKDNHPDHKVVCTVVKEAVYKCASRYFPDLGLSNHTVKRIREYEIWSPIPHPNLYIDIDKFLITKKNAIDCYKSQNLHRDYYQGITGLNRYRGFQSKGSEFAEAFFQTVLNEFE